MAGPGVLLRPPRHSIPHKAIPNDGMVGRGGGGNFRRINLRRNVYVGAHIRMCVCEECRNWGKSKRGERGRRRREARSQGGRAAGKELGSKNNSPDRTLYNLLYICSLQTSSSTLQPIKKTRSRDRNRTRAYSHTA